MARKPGRKAKPTALKLIDGNPGNRPLPQDEPKPAAIYNPDPPTYLSELEAAKWREVVAKLGACKVMTELDIDALAIYCREWIAMNNALADLAERGKLLQTPGGGVMWNPSWTQYKQSQKEVRSLQSEFGMTPSTRTGIAATADETGKDRWSEF